jgi:hypothetical protein
MTLLNTAPPEMAPPADELSLDRLARELGATCDVEAATVRRVVRAALRELRGSVSEHSMPEMATRLAAVRLLAYAPSQVAEPAP